MKLIERQRAEERSMLEGSRDGRRRRRRRKSRSMDVASCQNELTRVLERFVRNRCGGLDDVLYGEEDYDDDEDESVSRFSTGGESGDWSESEDDYTVTDSEDGSSVGGTRDTVSTTKSNKPIGSIRSIKKKKANYDNTETQTSLPSIKDKSFIKSFISKVTKSGMEVMLHKENRGQSLNEPSKVTASIKPGARTRSSRFVGPKFAWKAIDSREGGEIDLFDIRSLDKASVRQLEDYPLAMPGRSIFIQLNQGDKFLFEALNDEDAMRLNHGMRWVIARLAFNLIIGNLSVSCELLDVDRSGDPDSEEGRFPRTLKEEAHWTKAMNDVTSHLVDKADLP